MAQHKTAKAIALELGITYHAVESHLKAARRKLGVSSTAEALEWLRRAEGPYYGRPAAERAIGGEQYYRSPGLAGGSPGPHPDHTDRLDEAAFAGFAGRRKRVWEFDLELTPKGTVLLVGVATVGVIVALALLIVIGTGVNMLVSAQG